MGLYNFQKRFVPFILSGAKRHTIRATRRHPDKVGNLAHLYTGLRTKKTQLLGRFPITRIEEIEISAGCDCDVVECKASPRIFVAGVELDNDERENLARLDGFQNFSEMKAFWKGRLPFKGEIIHWNPSPQ